MIRAQSRQAIDGLIQRLRLKGERLALRHAGRPTYRHQNTGHKWRDATRLWPDIFKDR